MNEAPYIQTVSGINFTFTEPKSEDFNIVDIAHSLGMQCRFNGHTRRFYSVAEHCLNVARLLPREFKLEGLLHDASEAYITDIATPVKRLLPDYARLEAIVQGSVRKVFNLPEQESPEVVQADRACLVAEAKKYLPITRDHWIYADRYKSIYELEEKYVVGWLPEIATNLFLLRYDQYMKGIYTDAS